MTAITIQPAEQAMTDITSIPVLHLQLTKALQLEHATIPPYLTALYSLKPGSNTDAAQILRVVAVEEMLHLTIAANLLNAIGGQVDLTVPGFIPCYPTRLPDGETDFEIGLGPFTPDALNGFLKIERPAMAPHDAPRLIARHPRAYRLHAEQDHVHHLACPPDPDLRYFSIGEFYMAIREALIHFEAEENLEGRSLFDAPSAPQVTGEYYYSGGGDLEPISDLASALRGIDLIIAQGEGADHGIFGHPDANGNNEIAHYYRFKQLWKGHYYLPGDTDPEAPSGPHIAIDWSAIHPICPNLRLADFPADAPITTVVRDFNDAYRDFLTLLTSAFNGEPALMLEAVPGMFRLRDRFQMIVANPLPGTTLNACPTFEI